MKTETKPKPKRPTPQQERFARLVASGEVTKEEAYMDCYPSARKWKPASVRREATRLSQNPNILPLLAEIRAAAERAAAHRWQLSERERAIVAMLDAREATA